MKKLHTLLLAVICICISIDGLSQSPEWNLTFEEWNYNDTTSGSVHDTIIENGIGLFPPKWHYRPDHIPERTGLGQTTDATQGDYAVTLSGFYQYLVMKIISGQSAQKPGWPIDFKPQKLRGDYKAILLGTQCDSLRAYVDVFLTAYNFANGSRDTIGEGSIILKETSSSYEPFEVDINYLNQASIPDTVIIVLTKERFGFDTPPACLECGHVYFDNLQLPKTVSVPGQQSQKEGILLFPNPNKGDFTIQFNNQSHSYEISILASNGQLVQKHNDIKKEIRVDMGGLVKGLFLVRIKNEITGKYTYEKIIIE